MHSVFQLVISEYPRFATAVLPQNGAVALSVTELAEEQRLRKALNACETLFPLSNDRWAGQLWWFSWNNAVVAPAVTAMVEFYKTPSLQLDRGVLHSQPGDYWYSFSTDIVTGDGDWFQAARDYATSITPLIDALSATAGVKPAPLWAVAADALVAAAVSAGNESFDPYRGVRIACELSNGLSEGAVGVTIPEPRFEDIRDGTITATDMQAVAAGEEPMDVHTVARRASCCMIFHSPGCGKCLSCPKQKPEERKAKLIAHFQ
ncbi:MAG: (2Fe-2S)-binding protein [Corynebacterium sp.]|nr:(2Fe-2S)-binding protein [Corynebacterium sp.]